MRTLLLAWLLLAAGTAQAQSVISAGGALQFTLPGTTSIYGAFGYPGSTNDASTAPPYASFSAGAGAVFTFTAVSGGVNCCSEPANLNTPDGANFWPNYNGGGSTVGGINNFSDANGNTQLPLVAMFTDDTDPVNFASAPPALPAWDAWAPQSLAPGLRQVFYVGDGRAGYNDAQGALLQFTAPVGATRLYLGFVDAGGFNGTSSWYADNLGELQATLAMQPVPEPASWLLGLAGLAGLAGVLRRKR